MYSLEISPSSRARCEKCNNIIKMGDLRAKYSSSYSHCWKCIPIKNQELLIKIEGIGKSYNEWYQKNKERLVLECL